jgi:hypothetical protein
MALLRTGGHRTPAPSMALLRMGCVAIATSQPWGGPLPPLGRLCLPPALLRMNGHRIPLVGRLCLPSMQKFKTP